MLVISRIACQLLLACVVLLILVSYVGFRDILQVFADLRWYYIVTLIGMSGLLILVSCIKWQLFIEASGHKVYLTTLIWYYIQSYFFSLFLPSILGGDVARSYQLGKSLGKYKSAFAATFIERFTGLLAMAMLAIFFVILGADVTSSMRFSIIIFAGLIALSSIIIFSRKFSRLFCNLLVGSLKFVGFTGLGAKISVLLDNINVAMEFACNNYSLLAKAILLAFCFHFFAAVNTYIAALAVGWDDANLASLCVMVPLVLLVSAIPLTPSSIGIQEGAYFYFLTNLGSTDSQALAIGFILRAKNLLLAILGGLILFTSNGFQSNTNIEPK